MIYVTASCGHWNVSGIFQLLLPLLHYILHNHTDPPDTVPPLLLKFIRPCHPGSVTNLVK